MNEESFKNLMAYVSAIRKTVEAKITIIKKTVTESKQTNKQKANGGRM